LETSSFSDRGLDSDPITIRVIMVMPVASLPDPAPVRPGTIIPEMLEGMDSPKK
jgi:hypothetical protein